jgi:hypothetical protein
MVEGGNNNFFLAAPKYFKCLLQLQVFLDKDLENEN